MCSRSVYASLAKLDDHRLGGDHPRRSRGGIGLAIAGVPFAAVLTAVMFMLALAQIGPLPVFLAVGYTLLDAWAAEAPDADAPTGGAAPRPARSPPSNPENG